MPVTVHKILLHGPDVMRYFLLPIGQYSEKAADARNEDLRNIRQYKTRKISRVATNSDLAHSLLVNSNPFIGYLRLKDT